MHKWCHSCQDYVRSPNQTSISKYAAFWRDNKCPNCGSELSDEQPASPARQREEEIDKQPTTLARQREEEIEEWARQLLRIAAEAHRRRLSAIENAISIKPAAGAILLADIDAMTGTEFEDLVAALFADADRTVEKTKASGDQGGDIVVAKGGHREVIQVKRSRSPISNSAVQEVVAAKAVYGCQDAWVVTNAPLTNSAVALARANKVRVLDRVGLHQALRRKGPPAMSDTCPGGDL